MDRRNKQLGAGSEYAAYAVRLVNMVVGILLDLRKLFHLGEN
jgi:hypothetical protein